MLKEIEKLKPRKSDGRYLIRINTGEIDEYGKKILKQFTATTKEKLEEKVIAFLYERNIGLDTTTTADEETMEYYWLLYRAGKKRKVKESTLYLIDVSWQHLEPLHKMNVKNIKPIHLEKILYDLSDKGFSSRVISQVKQTACGALQKAVINRVVVNNCLCSVDLPKPAPKKVERRALTDNEISWFLNTPHRAQTAAVLMLYSGLRRGELLALTWDDIDLENRTITVNKELNLRHNQPTIDYECKSKSAKRVVAINQHLYDYLIQHKGEGIVVPQQSTGGYMSATAWRRCWNSYLCDLNVKYGYDGKANKCKPGGLEMKIPQITPHWLRHTYCSLMYKAGVDVFYTKEQLGHSDIRTTLEIYTHLDNEFKNEHIAKIDAYLDAKQG